MYSYSKFEHHYTKSHFKYENPISQDYRVFVNGEEIPVYTCQISKYPMNLVWKGYQRDRNQSEEASFVNLVSDEEIELKIVSNRPYKKVHLKPYSKGIQVEENGNEISFALKENGQFVLELDSYHHCLYIFNSKPMTCENPEKITYYFGAGVHMLGKITLRDDESVYVDKDALVFGNIFAENAKNIRIFGNGIFDDSFEERICGHCYEAYTNGNIKFYDCQNVTVEGVLFKNSAIWCVNLFHCAKVLLDDIKVFGQWRYNTDGIDIVNSQDITIRNSFVHSFDDTVTIKGIDRYAEYDNENILVENCTFWCDWGNVCEIGIEANVRSTHDVIFRNIDILRGGDHVLAINNGENSEVYNITYENINVEYNAFDTPSVLDAGQEYDKQNEIAIPRLIHISNSPWRTERAFEEWGVPPARPIDFTGIKKRCVHDVTVKNISVFYDEQIPLKDGKYNVPMVIKSVAEGVDFYGIEISDIKINGEKLDKEMADLRIEGIQSEVLFR